MKKEQYGDENFFVVGMVVIPKVFAPYPKTYPQAVLFFKSVLNFRFSSSYIS
jgi:hypothetical protein